jgi:hypothetical protein
MNEMAPKLKPSQREHYVNNKEFSLAVIDHARTLKLARAGTGLEPTASEYIGTCFLKICEGLSRKPNFIRYTYREEMVMDAVENCLKALGGFKADAVTRSGLPNAFAYFTQIAYFAFLRRIAIEKKQQDIKVLYMSHADISSFANFGDDGSSQYTGGESLVARVRSKVDSHQDPERVTKAKKPARKIARLSQKVVKSSLDMFFNRP